MPLTTFHCAVSKSVDARDAAVLRPASSSDSNIRYGLIATGAVADQRREVVDLARLAGLEHEPGLQARALAHEVVVHARDREQRRDRRPLGADRAVGEDQDVDAVGERLVGLRARALQRGDHAVRALRRPAT